MNTLTLQSDERLIFRRHPHIFVLLWLLLLLLLVFFIYITFFCPLAIATSLNGRCFPLAALAVSITGFLVCLDWWSTRYTLTTRRVIRERGIIGRQLMEIELQDIEDVKVAQDIPGRIFNYGTLTIESAGAKGKVRWVAIGTPLHSRNTLQQELHATAQ